MLSFTLDVQGEWMMLSFVVQLGVMPFAGAATVEAVEADIKAAWLINIVEALRAVVTIDGLCSTWSLQLCLLVSTVAGLCCSDEPGAWMCVHDMVALDVLISDR